MTDTETCLRDALAARADLVQPGDLRLDPVLRSEPNARRWWQQPTIYLVAAAAALVLALPVVVLAAVGSDDRRDDPVEQPSPTVTDTTTTAPQPTQWWEQHPDGLPDAWAQDQGVAAGTWLDGDLDGDGTSDRVRLSGSEGNVSLQVELDGGAQSLGASVDPAVVSIGPLTTVEGSDGLVIPVQGVSGAAGTTYASWFVYVVRDGQLVEAAAPATPFLGSQTSNLTEAEGGTDTWRTWVDLSGGIVTMSYDDQGTPIKDRAYPGAATKVYRNTFYRWSLDGTALVATEVGQGCTVHDDPAITACP